jgi:hypothetical protein
MKNRIILWFFPLVLAGLILISNTGCKKKSMFAPDVTTGEITILSDTTAMCSAIVNNDGNSEINARGICWCIGKTPQIGDFMTSEGIALGSFTSKLTGLVPNTTYYVRAYARNLKGASYGNTISFTAGH